MKPQYELSGVYDDDGYDSDSIVDDFSPSSLHRKNEGDKNPSILQSFINYFVVPPGHIALVGAPLIPAPMPPPVPALAPPVPALAPPVPVVQLDEKKKLIIKINEHFDEAANLSKYDAGKKVYKTKTGKPLNRYNISDLRSFENEIQSKISDRQTQLANETKEVSSFNIDADGNIANAAIAYYQVLINYRTVDQSAFTKAQSIFYKSIKTQFATLDKISEKFPIAKLYNGIRDYYNRITLEAKQSEDLKQKINGYKIRSGNLSKYDGVSNRITNNLEDLKSLQQEADRLRVQIKERLKKLEQEKKETAVYTDEKKNDQQTVDLAKEYRNALNNYEKIDEAKLREAQKQFYEAIKKKYKSHNDMMKLFPAVGSQTYKDLFVPLAQSAVAAVVASINSSNSQPVAPANILSSMPKSNAVMPASHFSPN